MNQAKLEEFRQELRKRLDHALERLIPEEQLQEMEQAFGAPTKDEKAALQKEKQEVEDLERKAASEPGPGRRLRPGWTTRRRLKGGP